MTVDKKKILIISHIFFICYNIFSAKAGSDIDILGISKRQPITNGYVIIDGKYIEPPYIVMRKGRGIYINNHLIEEPYPWPIPKKQSPTLTSTNMPQIPETITKKSTPYDNDVINYISKAKTYYLLKYGKDNLTDNMIKVYNELKCVKNASMGRDNNYIKVTWLSGMTDSIRITPFERKPINMTISSIIHGLEWHCSIYENCLKRGDYYIFGKNVRITGTNKGANDLFQKLIPVLNASKSVTDVRNNLRNIGIQFDSATLYKNLYDNRKSFANLKKRIFTSH